MSPSRRPALSGWHTEYSSDADSDNLEISIEEKGLQSYFAAANQPPIDPSGSAMSVVLSPRLAGPDDDDQVSEVDPDTRRLIENGENVTYVVRAGVLRTRLKPKSSINIYGARSSKDLLALCAIRLGWKILDANEPKNTCEFYWYDGISGDSYYQRASSLKNKNHRIRGFPMMPEFLKKSHTFNLINKIGALFPGEYQDGFPQTWLLPQQLKEFQEVLDNNKTETFIYKPSEGCQGDGITLFRRPADFAGLYSARNVQEDSVVQTYVSNPCLLNGYKFDLRLYVLVTSVNPVRAYIAREGLVRLCTEKYKKPTQANLHKIYKHLTNYSLNKRNANYEVNTNPESASIGSKRTVTAVFKEFAANGVDTDEIWESIDRLVSRSLVALSLPLSEAYCELRGSRSSSDACFQILGFDVLLDEHYQPWLLEINNNPSLSIDHEVEEGVKVRSPIDEIVKTAVVCSALEVIQHEKGVLDELTVWTGAMYDLILDTESDVVEESEMEKLDIITEIRAIFNHCKFAARSKHVVDPSRLRRLFRKSKLLTSRNLVVHDFDMVVLKIRPSGRDINILCLFDILLELSMLRVAKPTPTPYKALEILLDDLASCMDEDDT